MQKTYKTLLENLNKKLVAIEMYLNGTNAKDIAAQFNVSTSTVYYWVMRKDDIIKKKKDLISKMLFEAAKYKKCVENNKQQ